MKNLSPKLVEEVVSALRMADDTLSDVWNAAAAVGNDEQDEMKELQSVLDDIAAVLEKVEKAA